MIEQSELSVGDKVYYQPEHYKVDGTWENGIVKEIPSHTKDSVRVVYNCNGQWVEYMNYTSAQTYLSDLNIGWKESKDIVWSIVQQLHLLCEYSADGVNWQPYMSPLYVSGQGVFQPEGIPLRHEYCRVCTHQTIFNDATHIDTFNRLLATAGLTWKQGCISGDGTAYALFNIRPRSNYAYEFAQLKVGG